MERISGIDMLDRLDRCMGYKVYDFLQDGKSHNMTNKTRGIVERDFQPKPLSIHITDLISLFPTDHQHITYLGVPKLWE